MPRGRSGHTISAHNGKMYVWGGQHQGQYLNDLLIFSLKDCKLYVKTKGDGY